MSEERLEVLEARVDGIAEAFLALGAMLNREGVLDGQLLQAGIRWRAEELPGYHPALLEQMEYLADQLLRNYMHARGIEAEEIERRIRESKIPDPE